MARAALLDLFFPAQCAGCNALGSGLCDGCARAERIVVRFPGLRVAAYGAYEGGLRAAVLALKDGRRDVAEALASRVAPILRPSMLLVPVPTTMRRRRIRGMDGVAIVARRAAQTAGAQTAMALAHLSGDAQRGRSRNERLAARGRFACDPAHVAGARVTLFDDVCTTGATLRDAAQAVREAGGIVEDAVVVAVTKSDASWREPMAG